MGGGVEIDCFADDRKAFTLTVSVQHAWWRSKFQFLRLITLKLLGDAQTSLIPRFTFIFVICHATNGR